MVFIFHTNSKKNYTHARTHTKDHASSRRTHSQTSCKGTLRRDMRENQKKKGQSSLTYHFWLFSPISCNLLCILLNLNQAHGMFIFTTFILMQRPNYFPAKTEISCKTEIQALHHRLTAPSQNAM